MEDDFMMILMMIRLKKREEWEGKVESKKDQKIKFDGKFIFWVHY